MQYSVDAGTLRLALRRLSGMAILAVLGAAGLLLGGCRDEAAKSEPTLPVRVAVASFEPLVTPRRYVGTVRPRFEADLGFRIGGKIVERLVDVGDRVTAGAPIARLDATDAQLNLEAQQAELMAARSARDQAVAAEMRYRVLTAEGHVSKAALDQRVAAADEARSRVERAERAVAVQDNQLAYTILRADRDGVVSQLAAEKGQVVQAGQTVARVADLGELEVAVAIPEHLTGVLDGADARVELWAKAGSSYTARLRELAPQADRTARTFEARFSIVDGDKDVVLGRTATVVITARATPDVVALPLAAVGNDGQRAHVFVVRDSGAAGATVERRPVVVQVYGATQAFVGSGLAAGETVVTLGLHMLEPGRAVRVVERVRVAQTAPAAR